jgi:hypothetical protein
MQQTRALWDPVSLAYQWVHKAAHILNNDDRLNGAGVQRRLQGLLGAMSRHRGHAGALGDAITHFVKVTRSYWPGLFHCYDVPELPRTNNDLEGYFGTLRYNERRATGRKTASPSMVLRGSVRAIASVATRLHPFGAEQLRPSDTNLWKQLRAELDARRETRRRQLRFRRSPAAFLAELEQELLKSTLPP